MGIEIFGSTGIPVSPSVSGCYLFMSSCVFDIFRWKVMVTPHPLHASHISPFWHHNSSDIWPEHYQLQHIQLLFAVGNTISCSSWQTWGARKITVQHTPLETVQKAFFLCRRGPLYLHIACTLGTAQPCTGDRVDNTPWMNKFSESHFIILCFFASSFGSCMFPKHLLLMKLSLFVDFLWCWLWSTWRSSYQWINFYFAPVRSENGPNQQ